MKNSIFNKSALKQYILERAKEVRPGWKFTRVSLPTCTRVLEHDLNKIIDRRIHALPSTGKTIQFDFDG